MTTQAMVGFIGNKTMSRSFSDTATDDKWDQNLMLSTNSSQNLGLEMAGVTVDWISCTYTAGTALWRLRDSVSNKIERWGFCSKVGYVCDSELYIPPFTIKPTTLWEVYPMVVNGTANDTNCLGWIQSGSYAEPFGVTTTSDGTPTNLVSLVTGQSVGDTFFGKTINDIAFQCEDGATLVSLVYVQSDGASQWSKTGNVRLPTAGGTSTQKNIYAKTAIMVSKGDQLKISVTSA